MFDTHCHLTFRDFQGREAGVLSAARSVGVRGVITVATTGEDCLRAAAIAERHDGVWCTAGVHPLYAAESMDFGAVRAAAMHPRCVAWGELGLDNHYSEPPRSLQDRVLRDQLEVIEAATREGLAKPVVVHCREAFDELLEVFADTALDPSRFVFHCFTGTAEDARKVLDFGACISFTGVVTFKNASAVREAAKLVPADRIMVETDAPYLSPEPVRTMRPNEPKNVVHVARCLAALRGADPGEFEQQLDANAERFFGIELPPP